MDKRVANDKHAQKQADSASEKEPAFGVVLQIGAGEQNRHPRENGRNQPHGFPQMGRAGVVHQTGHLTEKPEQHGHGEQIETDAQKTALPTLGRSLKDSHGNKGRDATNHQQVVHDQKIGKQQLEKTDAHKKDTNQESHNGKHQFHVAKVHSLCNIIAGKQHFAQEIEADQRYPRFSGPPWEIPKQREGKDVAGNGRAENIKQRRHYPFPLALANRKSSYAFLAFARFGRLMGTFCPSAIR